MADAFRTLSLFDEPTVPVLEGALQWIPLRARMGGRAFGTNAYRAARAGDVVIEEARPGLAEPAAGEELLEPLRELEGWPLT